MLHRTDPAELPFPALEPFHCPQLISAQLLLGSLQSRGKATAESGFFPAVFLLQPGWKALYPPAASGGSCLSFPRTFSLDPLPAHDGFNGERVWSMLDLWTFNPQERYWRWGWKTQSGDWKVIDSGMKLITCGSRVVWPFDHVVLDISNVPSLRNM